MFRFNLIKEPAERTYGFALRLFGIDLGVVGCGYLDTWYLLYLKLFGKGVSGIYIQMLGMIFILGIKADILYGDAVEQNN